MPDFERALPIILHFEGGKVDSLDDPGGRTAYGIIQRTYDGWRVSKGLRTRDVWLIELSEYSAIYLERFWKRGSCSALAWPLSLLHFDACVNHGTEPKSAEGKTKVNAGRLLQRALQLPKEEIDGIVGPKTIQLTTLVPLRELCCRYLLERFFRYDELVDANPRLARFYTGGWEARLEHLYVEIT